jgi:hypothetical protein
VSAGVEYLQTAKIGQVFSDWSCEKKQAVDEAQVVVMTQYTRPKGDSLKLVPLRRRKRFG